MLVHRLVSGSALKIVVSWLMLDWFILVVVPQIYNTVYHCNYVYIYILYQMMSTYVNHKWPRHHLQTNLACPSGAGEDESITT